MAIKLEDLSPEDRLKLLSEAREIVEEENINKHAATMYALKKKEQISADVDAICNIFNFTGADKTRLKDKYSTMVNYLYNVSMNDKHRYDSNGVKITNAEQWNTFKAITEKVSGTIVNCIRIKEDK